MRMATNGFTDQEIEATALQDEPPANWMSANELELVIYRIDRMLHYFQTHDPATFQQALRIYRAIARAARTLFTQQYGYLPERSHKTPWSLQSLQGNSTGESANRPSIRDAMEQL